MSRLVVLFVLATAMVFVFQTTTSAPTESTPRCPANESWAPCGRGCEEVCLIRKGQCLFACIPTPGEGACACPWGYFRDLESDKCVLPQDCPKNYSIIAKSA